MTAFPMLRWLFCRKLQIEWARFLKTTKLAKFFIDSEYSSFRTAQMKAFLSWLDHALSNIPHQCLSLVRHHDSDNYRSKSSSKVFVGFDVGASLEIPNDYTKQGTQNYILYCNIVFNECRRTIVSFETVLTTSGTAKMTTTNLKKSTSLKVMIEARTDSVYHATQLRLRIDCASVQHLLGLTHD